MNIPKAVMHLFPNAINGVDYLVQDDSDGNGPYIAEWNLTDLQPTESALAAAWEIIKDSPIPKSDKELLTEARQELGRLNRTIDSLSYDVQAIIDTIVV